MSPKKIIEHIAVMRNRDDLAAIIKAAEARDNRLSNIESDERRKRLFAKFSHLRKGDLVFIHTRVETPRKYSALYGETLKVIQVKPRSKEIVVGITPLNKAYQGQRRVVLTAHTADALGLSERPSASAVTKAVVGEIE